MSSTTSQNGKMEESFKSSSSSYSSSYPLNLHMTPPGFESIYAACRRTYPDQPNPLQVTALTKYW